MVDATGVDALVALDDAGVVEGSTMRAFRVGPSGRTLYLNDRYATEVRREFDLYGAATDSLGDPVRLVTRDNPRVVGLLMECRGPN